MQTWLSLHISKLLLLTLWWSEKRLMKNGTIVLTTNTPSTHALGVSRNLVCFWSTMTEVIRASIHYAGGRVTARYLEVSKQLDSGLDFSNCSEIWQAHRQQRCRDDCQMWELYHNHNIHSCCFHTSRDLVVKCNVSPLVGFLVCDNLSLIDWPHNDQIPKRIIVRMKTHYRQVYWCKQVKPNLLMKPLIKQLFIQNIVSW